MLLLQVMIAHRDVIEARSPFLRVKNLGSWKLKERKEDWGKEEWLFDILEQSIIWPVIFVDWYLLPRINCKISIVKFAVSFVERNID